MDHAVQASAQRVRDHLRRPVPGSRNLLTNTAGNTVSEIDPVYQAEICTLLQTVWVGAVKVPYSPYLML